MSTLSCVTRSVVPRSYLESRRWIVVFGHRSCDGQEQLWEAALDGICSGTPVLSTFSAEPDSWEECRQRIISTAFSTKTRIVPCSDTDVWLLTSILRREKGSGSGVTVNGHNTIARQQIDQLVTREQRREHGPATGVLYRIRRLE